MKIIIRDININLVFKFEDVIYVYKNYEIFEIVFNIEKLGNKKKCIF